MFLHIFLFLLCIMCFQSIGKRSNRCVKKALKECCWAGLKLIYIPGGWDLGGGGAFIFLLSFPTRPLQQFPRNSIRCGGGELSVWIFRKVDHTWPLPGKMAAHYWEWPHVWTSLYIKQCLPVSTCKITPGDAFSSRSSFTRSKSVVRFQQAFVWFCPLWIKS